MLKSASMKSFALLPLPLVVVAALFAACSSSAVDSDAGVSSIDAGTPSNEDADTVNDTGTSPVPDATPDLQIRPPLAYTGVDGTHVFKVPVAVYGAAADLSLTASDSALVTLAPATLANPTGDDGKYYLVTAKKAGTVTLTATSGGRSVTSQLTITDYPAARYSAGETKYKAGYAPKSEPPCTQCHTGAGGVDHSPASLASIADEEVKVIISTGILNGAPIPMIKHQWTTTPDEMDGLVTFLRALPPKGLQ